MGGWEEGMGGWVAGWLGHKKWTGGSSAHCYPQGKRIAFERINKKTCQAKCPTKCDSIDGLEKKTTTKCGAFPRTANGRNKKMRL